MTDIFGAGGYEFTLTSECVGGRRATVTILAVGPALGLSAFLDISFGNITVNDSHSDLRPSTFNGYFQYTTAGYALGFGYGAYAVAIGTDGSMYSNTGAYGSGHGPYYGYGVGASSVAGSSTVTDVQYENCSSCEQ